MLLSTYSSSYRVGQECCGHVIISCLLAQTSVRTNMELQELQLGDVVQVVVTTQARPGKPAGTVGQATIIGLDPNYHSYQVMVGWDGEEAPFGDGRDSYVISHASY